MKTKKSEQVRAANVLNKEAAAAMFLHLLWTVVSEPPAIVTVAYQDNSAEQKQKHHRMFAITILILFARWSEVLNKDRHE